MKRALLLLATLFAATLRPAAQEMKADAVLPIWDNATAPHSNELADPEGPVRDGRPVLTTRAVLYLYAPDPATAKNRGVVICPGGGYRHLSMENEGARMAEWFAANGYTAAVLHYRMPNGHPEVPLEDVEQALRLLTGAVPGAEGFTVAEAGVVGSSAGGHLAAMVSTMGSVRPAFTVLFYPVITADPTQRHQGSFDNLLGSQRSAENDRRYSLDTRVTEQTPPAFLLLADDDSTVPPTNAARYYAALKAHGITASLHIYPIGGHGFGMRDSFPFKASWQALLLDWLERLD